MTQEDYQKRWALIEADNEEKLAQEYEVYAQEHDALGEPARAAQFRRKAHIHRVRATELRKESEK